MTDLVKCSEYRGLRAEIKSDGETDANSLKSIVLLEKFKLVDLGFWISSLGFNETAFCLCVCLCICTGLDLSDKAFSELSQAKSSTFGLTLLELK